MLNRRAVLPVLVCGLLFSGCGDVTGPPRAVGPDAVEMRATLSTSTISVSSIAHSVLVSITVRNPHPYPVTLVSETSFPWWSLTITPVDDPFRGTWSLQNSMRPLTLEARADMVHTLVLRLRDPALGMVPGQYEVRGGLDRTMSAATILRVNP